MAYHHILISARYTGRVRGRTATENQRFTERGWMLSCLPGQINSSNHILVAANEKEKKPYSAMAILYLSRSWGAHMNKSLHFTLTAMKAGLKVFVMEKDMPASSLTSVISQTVALRLSAPVGLSGLSAAECSSLVLGRDQWIREDNHTRPVVWSLTGGPSPKFWPWAILWSPTSTTLGTLGPWALSGPSQVASSPQHPSLTKSGRGNCVDVNLFIADLLVALPVGRWLGQDRTLIAMAPGHFVHTLDHAWLEAFPTGWGALQERRHWDMVHTE